MLGQIPRAPRGRPCGGWSRPSELQDRANVAVLALREPLPRHTTAADKRQTVNADALLRVHEHGYYVKGWVYDAGAAPGRLTAVSTEGSRVELLDHAFRHSRPDVGASEPPPAR